MNARTLFVAGVLVLGTGINMVAAQDCSNSYAVYGCGAPACCPMRTSSFYQPQPCGSCGCPSATCGCSQSGCATCGSSCGCPTSGCSAGGCSNCGCNAIGQRFTPAYAATGGYMAIDPMSPPVNGAGSCGCNSNGSYQPNLAPVGRVPVQTRITSYQPDTRYRGATTAKRVAPYGPRTASRPATNDQSATSIRLARNAKATPVFRTVRTAKPAATSRGIVMSDLQFETVVR